MDCPKLYIKENGIQRRDVRDITVKYLEKMIWRPNEIVLDVGCGPGDVTSEILYPFLKNKIEKLIGVDKSIQMVEYAKKNFKCSKMDFKVLDIENNNDCIIYSQSFNKIFSFFCFHWVHNKVDALVNMHSMLKSNGEILVNFLLVNPLVELHNFMDAEWDKYIKDITPKLENLYSQDKIKDLFMQVGFKIISIESSAKNYTFPDLSSLLNAIKAVDDMYNVLPPHLHEKYSNHVKDTICERQLVDICPITGKTTKKYLPITIHAIKE